ncbi:MAG TPA: PIN domain-containing protein [Chromatiaceae bacterium]|jgi:predicted nucleic acid-binding protein|nr:MAG: DNA-binding protein [Thiohalocapsa sp. PB-PSB1]QQO53344.1 MAG: type II toxin-antitoxin system VapC family toxin [Thiohalocapsa sp. PB-PSB1]HBG95248.1 PIN domain-containing protein [Chromatiaceae bacterium]HCS92424.1 PIN domain-containing protein [Chromatiaceae bacterium]
MKKSVYIETSIPSYLTARPNRDLRAAAWQQLTVQWWDEARAGYDLFTSELALLEASAGNPEAAKRRLESLQDIPELEIDEEVQKLAEQLIAESGVPATAEADALHIAVAAIHRMDYLLTWNCRHIGNAAKKPIIRAICKNAGYPYPEICTPMELLPENESDVPR